MVHRQILAFLEPDAVEFSKSIENTVVENAFKLKVGLNQVLVDFVFLGSYFLGIIFPVPCLRFSFETILLHESLNIDGFGFRLGKYSRHEILQHLEGS